MENYGVVTDSRKDPEVTNVGTDETVSLVDFTTGGVGNKSNSLVEIGRPLILFYMINESYLLAAKGTS